MTTGSSCRGGWKVIPAGLLAAAVLAVAGCGNGSGGVDDGELGTAGTVTTSPNGSGVLSDDEELARAVNVALGDFPLDQRWTREPGPPHDASAAADRLFALCLGQDHDPSRRSAELDSDVFTGPGGVQVSSTVVVHFERSVAVETFDSLQGADAPRCLKENLDEALRSQTGRDPGESEVQRLEFPDTGEGAVAFRYRAGDASGLVVDTVFVRVGEVTFNVSFVGLGSPAPASLQHAVAGAMAARA